LVVYCRKICNALHYALAVTLYAEANARFGHSEASLTTPRSIIEFFNFDRFCVRDPMRNGQFLSDLRLLEIEAPASRFRRAARRSPSQRLLRSPWRSSPPFER
jgi:hypothetical protein